MNILEQIVADKRLEIAALKKAVPESTLVLHVSHRLILWRRCGRSRLG